MQFAILAMLGLGSAAFGIGSLISWVANPLSPEKYGGINDAVLFIVVGLIAIVLAFILGDLKENVEALGESQSEAQSTESDKPEVPQT